ncbi:MAG: hypothetical protein QGG87_03800 [Nitrospinota bacterium]|nr:hypothetical protein [Nitrospinota bacterium]
MTRQALSVGKNELDGFLRKVDRSDTRDGRVQLCRNHNFITKIKLDGFRRKTARRVEAMDGRNHNGALAPAS